MRPRVNATKEPPEQIGALVLNRSKRTVQYDRSKERLTPTELAMLDLFRKHPGCILNETELEAGTRNPLKEDVVRKTDGMAIVVNSLRNKLSAVYPNAGRYIRLVYKAGYVFEITP